MDLFQEPNAETRSEAIRTIAILLREDVGYREKIQWLANKIDVIVDGDGEYAIRAEEFGTYEKSGIVVNVSSKGGEVDMHYTPRLVKQQNNSVGERRVNLYYTNLTSEQKQDSHELKKLVAELIDKLEMHKQSKDWLTWDQARDYANAMTYLEIWCMLGVKAIYN